jgi:Putative adhesin
VSAELAPGARDPRPLLSGLRRITPWGLVLVGSAAALLIAGAVLGAVWLSSTETRIVSSHLPASLGGIELHVQSGEVAIVGGSQTGVSITRSDRSVFGQGPREQRSLRGGILRITSGCPHMVVGSCSASYRIEVPNNVPISIRTEHGDIRLDGYRGSADIATDTGAINVEGYCGFVLGAASASGDVTVSTACSPERLTLRSDSGDVSATVPPGNYGIQAASNGGSTSVRGLIDDGGAPWAIQALSNTGNVRLSAGS